MQKLSEILKNSKKRLEEKKKLVKQGKIIPPDLVDLQEVQRFVHLPDKAKENMGRDNPMEYDRLLRLIQKVWDQWQVWFMDQDRDAEHPFVKGFYVRRWNDSIETVLGDKK